MLVSVCSRSLARGSAYHSSGIGSVRLSLIRYLGLGSSRLLARAQLGTRESAQWARLNSELGLGSARGSAQGSPGNWFGARDSGFDLACLMAHLASLVSAWCLGSGRGPGSVRLGSPARLETQGSAQDLALGLDRSPGRLISVRKIL